MEDTLMSRAGGGTPLPSANSVSYPNNLQLSNIVTQLS